MFKKLPRLKEASESYKPLKYYGEDGWMFKYLRGETFEIQRGCTAKVLSANTYKWARRSRRPAS